MPDAAPLNDLERTFAAAMKSAGARPALFHLLRDSELCFLMPWHPEMTGTMDLSAAQPVAFVSLTDAEGKQLVPLFTAPERARESVEKLGIRERHALGQIQGLTVFQILAAQSLEVVLNPRCSTGEARFDKHFCRMVADGSIFKPLIQDSGEGPEKFSAPIIILDPADYPTDIVQAAFDYLRQHRTFRAAWIFADALPSDSGKAAPGKFCIGLYMEPADTTLIQELGITVRAVAEPDRHCHFMVLDPGLPKTLELMENVPPFFVADDYPKSGRGNPSADAG